MRRVLLGMVLLMSVFGAKAQIYLHNFTTNANATNAVYTAAPNTLDANLSNSSWTNSLGLAFDNRGGNAGNSLSVTNPSTNNFTYTLTFTVATGFQMNINSFSFWNRVNNAGPLNWALTINGISVGNGTTINGGGNVNTTNVSNPIIGLTGNITVVMQLTNVSGTNGQFRLDDFTLFGAVQSSASFTNYYSKPTGALNATATWGTNTDGTGTAPTNFTNARQIFNIRNNAAPTLTANWTVSGNGSRIITGDGTNAVNFTIPAGSNLNAASVIDVSANATLTILNTVVPSLNTLATTSTVNYGLATGTQNLKDINYGNLTLSGGGTRVFPNGIVGIAGVFTPGTGFSATQGTIDFRSAGAQSIPAFNYNTITNSGNGSRTLGVGIVRVGSSLFDPGTGSYTAVTNNTVEYASNNAAITFNLTTALPYYNLIFSGAATYDFNGTNLSISNDFTVAGADVIQNSINVTNNFNIGRNFNISSGTYIMDFSVSGTTGISIGGDYNQTGGIFIGNFFTGNNNGVSISGNYNLSGTGNFGMLGDVSAKSMTVTVNGLTTINTTANNGLALEFTSSNNGVAIFEAKGGLNIPATATSTFLIDFGAGTNNGNEFRVGGNFTKAAGSGTFNTTSTTASNGFVFDGTSGTQTFSYAGTNSLYTQYNIKAGSKVQMLTGLVLGDQVNPRSTFTVNGTLDVGTNVISSTADAITTINNGGTLITANTGGVAASITVATNATRIFNTGANYEFNSTVANQSTGFTGITLNNPSNILISNTGGTVTLDANVTFTNNANLTVNSGSILNANTRTFTYGTGGNAAINGSFLTGNTNGFSGGTATSIINTNTPTVSLGATSTVNYTATSGNQNITNAVAYQNLTLSGTGTKTAPAGTITILGNYNKATATANFVHNNGTVLFAGTAAQSYTSTGASTFYDITNNNAVNLNINNDTLNVVNTLNMGNNAKLNLMAGNICLKSSSTATANVTAIPATAAITYSGTGRFNIERYLFAKKSWRSLATPIEPSDPTTVTQAWRENGINTLSTGYGTQITGPSTTGGFDQNTIRGSLKSYNMDLNNFEEVTNTSVPIYNRSGYFVFVRGDRAVNTTGTTGATTLRMSGRIVRNDQVYNITANKFISIGNPYASRVDVRNLTLGGGVSPSFYVWNPNSPGSYNVGAYEVYFKDISTGNYRSALNGAINNFIESGQAVFFQASPSTGGTITFTEASKASGSSLVSRIDATERPGATTPSLSVQLKTTDVDGTVFNADGILVDFDNNLSNDIDENDVRKVSNTADNLGIRKQGNILVVERRNMPNNNDTIFLNIAGLRTTNYRFEIDPSLIDGLGLEAFLVDAFLGTQTPVSLTDVTTINFATTADAASKANNRFMLVFKPAAVLPVTFTTITAVRDAINKQVAVRWNVATEINITRYEVERSATGTGFAPIATVNPTNNNGGAVSYSINDAAALATTNFYRVKAISNNGTVQYSAVVKVAALPTASGFVVYPNPVVGNTINLQANQVTKGAYNVQLVNQAGQIVYKGLVNINSDNQSTSVVLDAATAAGVYTLVLENEGKKVQIAVLVK